MPREGSGDERARAMLARVEAGEMLVDIGQSQGISAQRVHQLVTRARKAREAAFGKMDPKAARYPRTPDGRYFVVRGRLWRLANPALSTDERSRLVHDLMAARRGVADARVLKDEVAEKAARDKVDRTKRALGERGPVWWTDGAPDLNRRMVHTTVYAEWYASLSP